MHIAKLILFIICIFSYGFAAEKISIDSDKKVISISIFKTVRHVSDSLCEEKLSSFQEAFEKPIPFKMFTPAESEGKKLCKIDARTALEVNSDSKSILIINGVIDCHVLFLWSKEKCLAVDIFRDDLNKLHEIESLFEGFGSSETQVYLATTWVNPNTRILLDLINRKGFTLTGFDARRSYLEKPGISGVLYVPFEAYSASTFEELWWKIESEDNILKSLKNSKYFRPRDFALDTITGEVFEFSVKEISVL